MGPLVEIWKVDLSGSIHMLAYFHLIKSKFNVHPKSFGFLWIRKSTFPRTCISRVGLT